MHIGQDDISAEEARDRLGSDRILGISTHNEKQVDEAISKKALIDYFSMGAIYPSQTKPEAGVIGLNLIEYAASENSDLPFIALAESIDRILFKLLMLAQKESSWFLMF